MQVTRRNVFYLSGFDPRGVRLYYQHYRDAAVRYSQLTGKRIAVSPRRGQDWTVENHSDGVHTDYTFLAWDDLVRAAWIRKPLQLVWHSLVTYFYYVRDFRWQPFLARPRGPAFALIYPLLWHGLLPLALAGLLAVLIPFWLALPLTFTLAALFGERVKSLWLMRLFIYNARLARKHDAALDPRLDQFVDTLVRSFENTTDEILLVAHSKGSIILIYLLEKLLQRTGGHLPEHFRILTLGHCIPIISFFRRAPHFHAAMQRVAQSKLYWADIGSPPDSAAYCKTDPFLPDYPQHQVRLHMRNPRFFAYDEPATYARLRRNKYTLHFRYLTPGGKPSPLDYLALTAGPRPLPDSMATPA